MKKMLMILIFSFFVINILTLKAEDYNFSVERVFTDFNGVCHNDNVIIAYGNYGLILISTDKGHSWTQKKIVDDSLNIKKIINVGDNFYGICDKNYLIKSVDNGQNWNQYEIPTNINNYDITNDENYLYILSYKKILIYNFYCEIIDSITLNWYVSQIAVVENSIVFNYYTNLYFLDIDNNYSIDSLNINIQPNSIKVYDGKLYSITNNSLFVSEPPNWEFNRLSHSVIVENFVIHQGNIYLSNIKKLSNGLSSINFFKLSNNGENEKINIDSTKRYFLTNKFPFIKDIEFIDDNTIIAVGFDKTIFLSSDKGVRWKLKSNVSTGRKFISVEPKWINPNVCFFINEDRVFKTTDAGVTWLPQIFTESFKYIKGFDVAYFDSSGKGFAFTKNPELLSDSSKNVNLIYTEDFGETFKKKFINDLKYIKVTQYKIRATKIDNESFISIVPVYGTHWTPANDRNVTVLINFDSLYNIHNVYTFDSIKIFYLKNIGNKTLEAIGWEQKEPKSDGEYLISRIVILKSTDLGNNWERTLSKDITLNSPWVYIANDKEIIFKTNRMIMQGSSYHNIYHLNYLDLTNNKLQIIYNDTAVIDEGDRIPTVLFKFKDNLYINDKNNNILYTNNYRSEMPDWKIMKSFPDMTKKNKSTEIRHSINYNDSIIYTTTESFQNDIFLTNIFKLYPERTTYVPIKIERSSYFFATPPVPIPANEQVSFDIYWDQEIDVSQAQIKVYNVLGELVSDNNDILIINNKPYSEKIIWNCSKVPSGLYFVTISYRNFSRSVPIVIKK